MMVKNLKNDLNKGKIIVISLYCSTEKDQNDAIL